MWLTNILIFILTVLLVYIFNWIRKTQNYFIDLKIPYFKSPPLLGAYFDVVVGREGVYDQIEKIYNNPELKDEKYFGMFLFHKPALFLKDLDIIKRVMITDFNSFNDRYSTVTKHDATGYYQPFFLKNPLWKTIRSKLTPFFSSAKLKSAYYLIEKLGREFNGLVASKIEKSGKNRAEFDIKNLTDFFTTDVISSIAFGVDANTMKNSGSEFYKAALAVFDSKNTWRGFEMAAMFLMPQITKFFNFKMFSHFTTKFVYDVMPDVIAERVKSGSRRNDLIDMLLDIKDDLKPEHESHTKEDMMYAQIAAFLAAGYETSSTTSSLSLYELTKQPELQQRLRDELKEALIRTKGQITYEMAANPHELPLLHQTVLETLRMYSVISYFDRICTNNSGVAIDDGKFIIPKGMPILIPVYSLCRDEKYFDNPLEYNPDRFSPENIHTIPSLLTNISFGTGPRYCIGERLGYIKTKTAIMMMLKDFRLERNQNTPETLKFVKKAMVMQSEKRLLVDFVKDPLF